MIRLIALFVMLIPLAATAQEVPTGATGSVTIAAKGTDVRDVLSDLFTQAKKSFVLEPNVRQALYLSLAEVPFDEALALVCKTAELKFELQNGIYHVGKIAKAVVPPKPEPPKGKLPASVLERRVNTRLSKAELKSVLGELAKQAKIMIELDPSVPGYRLDAFLNSTSLRYALDTMTRAMGLTYTFTDNLSIKIGPAAENKIVVVEKTSP